MKKLLTISMVLNLLLILLLGYSSRDIIKEKIFPSPKEEYTTHYLERKSLFEKLIPKNGVVFLGDSITEGGEWAGLFSSPSIQNRGISGDTTKGILNRLDSLISMSPKKVFIMIGINDLSKGVSVSDILRNYESIIQRLKAETTAEIYIQSVLPATPKLKDRIAQVNQKLKELSGAENTDFIDLFSLFSQDGNMNKNYSYDGIHLNGSGYEIWSKEIKTLVQ